MELVKFKTEVIDNILIITPEEGFLDNSVYEIRLKNINSEKNDVINQTINLCTKLSPLFVDIYSVKSIIHETNIPDDVILYHIREASRFAEYIKGGKIDEDNVPFEVTQFVKYKAAHESILRHIVTLSSSSSKGGTVGNVKFDEKETSKDISKLLEHLCKEVNKWIDEVKGFKLEGRAEMKTAVRAGSKTPEYSSIGVNFKRGVSKNE